MIQIVRPRQAASLGTRNAWQWMGTLTALIFLSTNACVVSALREREQRLISRRMAVPLSYASAYMLGFACASPHGQIISIEPKPQPVLAHTRRRDGILLVFIVLQHLAQMADA